MLFRTVPLLMSLKVPWDPKSLAALLPSLAILSHREARPCGREHLPIKPPGPGSAGHPGSSVLRGPGLCAFRPQSSPLALMLKMLTQCSWVCFSHEDSSPGLKFILQTVFDALWGLSLLPSLITEAPRGLAVLH